MLVCTTLKCVDFHEGRFQIGDGYIIERKEGVQVEHNFNQNRDTKDSIHWINDCEYELTTISSAKELDDFYSDKKVLVTIDKVIGDTAFCTIKVDSNEMEFKMIKLRD
jgi:hypothetical protein